MWKQFLLTSITILQKSRPFVNFPYNLLITEVDIKGFATRTQQQMRAKAKCTELKSHKLYMHDLTTAEEAGNTNSEPFLISK